MLQLTTTWLFFFSFFLFLSLYNCSFCFIFNLVRKKKYLHMRHKVSALWSKPCKTGTFIPWSRMINPDDTSLTSKGCSNLSYIYIQSCVLKRMTKGAENGVIMYVCTCKSISRYVFSIHKTNSSNENNVRHKWGWKWR